MVSCISEDKFIVTHWSITVRLLLCQEMAVDIKMNSYRILLNILMGARALLGS